MVCTARARVPSVREGAHPNLKFKESEMKFVGKTSRNYSILALLLVAVLAGCSKSVPQDGAQAKVMRFDGLNNLRYCEIFLIGGNPITKDLQGAVYNTTALNDAGHPQDTCPADMWAKVDIEQLKKQYDLLGVFKNGPRYWMYDWIELPVGTQHDFNGLQARWFAQVQLPKDFKKEGSTSIACRYPRFDSLVKSTYVKLTGNARRIWVQA